MSGRRFRRTAAATAVGLGVVLGALAALYGDDAPAWSIPLFAAAVLVLGELVSLSRGPAPDAAVERPAVTGVLTGRLAAALLRYLAVAHFGRGRGDWVEGEYPAHWRTLVDEVVARHRGRIDAVWERASAGAGPREIEQALRPVLTGAARDVLARLYPGAAGTLAAPAPAG